MGNASGIQESTHAAARDATRVKLQGTGGVALGATQGGALGERVGPTVTGDDEWWSGLCGSLGGESSAA